MPLTPYYADDWCTIYHGDCREIVDDLTFDVVVTDPPYGVGWVPSRRFAPVVGDDSSDLAAWACGLLVDYPGVVFGASHFPGLLPHAGRWLCWDKRVHPNADRMPGAPFELAWSNCHRFDEMIRVQHGGAVNADSLTGNAALRVHPTQKPVRVMSAVLAGIPAGAVLDPFMGSGTTLVAAKHLGRRAIGIEIEERYCEIAAKRLAQEVLDFAGVTA